MAPELKRVEPTPANLAKAAETLYVAFADDPLQRALMSAYKRDDRDADAFRRRRLFPGYVKAAALSSGELWALVDGEQWLGVSIWLPPRKTIDGTWTALRAGMLHVFWNLGWKGVKMCMAGGMQEAERIMREVGGIKNHACWYCFFLGVVPEHQVLMSPHVPVDGLSLSPTHDASYPGWLESTTEHSRRVYLKLGFEEVGSARFARRYADELGHRQKAGAGVVMYCMIQRNTGEPA